MSAIENFPPPSDLTSARSWFGLVNQVAWAYSISPIMQPFCKLIKPHNKFFWDDNMSVPIFGRLYLNLAATFLKYLRNSSEKSFRQLGHMFS